MPRSLPDGSIFDTRVGQGLLGENPKTIPTSVGLTTFATAAAFHNELKAVARRATTPPTSVATCAALKSPRRNVLSTLGSGGGQVNVNGSSSLMYQSKSFRNVISNLRVLVLMFAQLHMS